MLKQDEFREWLSDYQSRWPAVADYVKRQANPAALYDTWHQSLAGFDGATLDRVTLAIIAGDMEPVDNFKLGTFGNEIRQRCRKLLDRDRQDHERRRASEMRRSHHATFTPLKNASLKMMMACAIAAEELASEKTGRPIETRVRRYMTPNSVRCDVPYDAAIILADDHTEDEEREAMATLDEFGVAWEEVVQRANELLRTGLRMLQSVPNAEENDAWTITQQVAKEVARELYSD